MTPMCSYLLKMSCKWQNLEGKFIRPIEVFFNFSFIETELMLKMLDG